MNKEEALLKLKAEAFAVEADQEFEVHRMQPEDARGVARCFYAVYGEHYPFDTYYIPDKLIEENEKGNVISVVARTGSGDVIGYSALYRSSAFFSGTYEIGQALVLPEYRFTFAAYCLWNYLMDLLDSMEGIHEIFGEAVCNHIISQKMMTMAGMEETGIELGLMPAEAFSDLQFPDSRVSTLLGFKTVRDKTLEVHIPGIYARALEFIISTLGTSRVFMESSGAAPQDLSTEVAPQFIDYAHVVRFNCKSIGTDFAKVLTDMEMRAQGRQARVTQAFVNLGDPGSGWAVDLLRQRGYFFGGFLPRWFDTDGMLMQKPAVLPQFESIKLSSARARKILDIVREDIEHNPACRHLLKR
jgi:hypothetical protein